MIYGIGLDIVRIDRIVRVMARTRGRFATKVLGIDELKKYQVRTQHCRQRAFAFLASRFAAKEAFAKAIGLGMRQPMGWQAMQTINQPGGRPFIVANSPLALWLRAQRLVTHISVSDEQEYAAAIVLVERIM